jgi:transcriptional regulator with XRE-family HTH domain
MISSFIIFLGIMYENASNPVTKGVILTFRKIPKDPPAENLPAAEQINSSLRIDIKALNKKVGQAIARQRIKADMTQDFVASQLEIAPESVSRLETGVFSSSLERLAQFSILFNCPIDTFLRDDETEKLNELADSLETLINPLGHVNLSLGMNFISQVIFFIKNLSSSRNSNKK